MSGKRIIVTGQSGIGIAKAIESFRQDASAFTKGAKPPYPVKLEDIMGNIHCQREKRPRRDTIWMDEILKLPIRDLQSLWDNAFRKLLGQVSGPKFASQDVILHLHASFYHQETVEHISLARDELIREFKPDVFITFIDDIYDIHARLRSPHQMFSPSFGGASEPVGCIFELLRILDWRAAEIMMTRHLAEACGRKYYVFAIKHACDTLYKLLYGESPIFYISHPITQVRKLQRAGKAEQSNAIEDEIHRFEAGLSQAYVCFLPTTIDEWRIRKTGEGATESDSQFCQQLSPRWDAEKYRRPVGLLYAAPNEGTNPLWTDADGPVSGELNLLLKELDRNIHVQVSSRDHKLVEQSDYLAVYRPCFDGNASRGVRREIDYYLRLKEDARPKKCFIYAPRKDQNLFKTKQFEMAIQNEIKEGRIRYEEGSFELSGPERNNLIAAAEPDTLKEVARNIIDGRRGKMSVVPEPASGVDSDAAQRASRILDDVLEKYRATCQEHLAAYREAGGNEFWEDELTPEQFVGKIIEQLSRVAEDES